MSVKSKILPVLALTATLGLSACVAHVREPGYGYYGGHRGGYYGHSQAYSSYPQRTVVYRRSHDDDYRYRRHTNDGDRYRRTTRYRSDGDRDNDGIHDRYDRND